jgi:hypothetical protein
MSKITTYAITDHHSAILLLKDIADLSEFVKFEEVRFIPSDDTGQSAESTSTIVFTIDKDEISHIIALLHMTTAFERILYDLIEYALTGIAPGIADERFDVNLDFTSQG